MSVFVCIMIVISSSNRRYSIFSFCECAKVRASAAATAVSSLPLFFFSRQNRRLCFFLSPIRRRCGVEAEKKQKKGMRADIQPLISHPFIPVTVVVLVVFLLLLGVRDECDGNHEIHRGALRRHVRGAALALRVRASPRGAPTPRSRTTPTLTLRVTATPAVAARVAFERQNLKTPFFQFNLLTI